MSAMEQVLEARAEGARLREEGALAGARPPYMVAWEVPGGRGRARGGTRLCASLGAAEAVLASCRRAGFLARVIEAPPGATE